jgi:mannose/cellobiose epimerase-like protein (N-acyl-D-glucosamine 2-epimerase family)
VDYLINKAWNGPDNGFARKLTREGAPLDPTPDLYDHAFVLFALSPGITSASGDATSRDWMHRDARLYRTHLRVAATAKASGMSCRPRAGVSKTRTCI